MHLFYIHRINCTYFIYIVLPALIYVYRINCTYFIYCINCTSLYTPYIPTSIVCSYLFNALLDVNEGIKGDLSRTRQDHLHDMAVDIPCHILGVGCTSGHVRLPHHCAGLHEQQVEQLQPTGLILELPLLRVSQLLWCVKATNCMSCVQGSTHCE